MEYKLATTTHRQFKKARNQSTKMIREGRLRYQIKPIEKLIANPKSLFFHDAILWQAEIGVSQVVGPVGLTNNDDDATNLLSEQSFQTFQTSDNNYVDKRLSTTHQYSRKWTWVMIRCVRNWGIQTSTLLQARAWFIMLCWEKRL